MSSPGTSRDEVFAGEGPVRPFEFSQDVARAFDDMAERSIPFYREVQGMVRDLALRFFQPGTRILDLGSSTGWTSALIYQALREQGQEDFRILSLDSSAPMTEEAHRRREALGADPEGWEIRQGDILTESLAGASVVILNYTLQFIPPLKREGLVRRIYQGLSHQGILLVSDKMLQESTDLSRIFIDEYYGFKGKQGYSTLEIARKREALENVLVPYRLKEEEALFRRAGFEAVELFFSWYNFSSFLCLKQGD